MSRAEDDIIELKLGDRVQVSHVEIDDSFTGHILSIDDEEIIVRMDSGSCHAVFRFTADTWESLTGRYEITNKIE